MTRESHLRRLYGITVEQYDQLLEKQGNSCPICQRDRSHFKTNLCVDHNHTTGEIRGLLCGYCNRRLIGRHKDGDLLRRMAAYVDGGTGLFVPEEFKTGRKKPRKRKTK
jgi:hypothetical protein